MINDFPCFSRFRPALALLSALASIGARTSEKSKRRTRALASTLEPRWNQTFLYSHLRRSELRSRFLEITVWDSDRLDTGRLIGEVRLAYAIWR